MGIFLSHDDALRGKRTTTQNRPGAAAVLIVFMMFVFVVMAAVTVDYSYMQLVRSELRSAADAAAKAGAEALTRTQNTRMAQDEAIRYAALNTVGGKSFQLNRSDVLIGRVVPNDAGKWVFNANGTPPNAVRINARTGAGAAQAAVPLFFSRIVGHNGFAPSHEATAGQQEVEVCLCLDRSGSMTFDMTGVDFSFPPGNPNLIPFTAWGTEWQNMLSPPHPSQSRWSALDDAVDVFFAELSSYQMPRTSLVTWASTLTLPIPPYTTYPAATTDVPLPAMSGFDGRANVQAITSLIQARGRAPLFGGTNLGAGLDQAIRSFETSASNRFASKVVILLTDGQWNDGNDPAIAARVAKSKDITVHCVSMLTDAQPILRTIADTTGGRYWSTRNNAELRLAFRELARSLPIVLTE